MPEEAIELVGVSETDAAGLSGRLSKDEPRYSFFRYRREAEGREDGDVAFIYTCPPGSKVKERMVYACSVRGVMATASKEVGLEVTKRVSGLGISSREVLMSGGVLRSKPRVPRKSSPRQSKTNSVPRRPRRSKSRVFRDRSGQAGGDVITQGLSSIAHACLQKVPNPLEGFQSQ